LAAGVLEVVVGISALDLRTLPLSVLLILLCDRDKPEGRVRKKKNLIAVHMNLMTWKRHRIALGYHLHSINISREICLSKLIKRDREIVE
jgi:hypothetical protein